MRKGRGVLPVYVINLDRSQDWWQNATMQLGDLAMPHARLTAVDGDDLTPDEMRSVIGRKPVLYRWLRDLSPSEIGCYLSHRTAWEPIAGSGRTGGFVFEDDFVAGPDLFAVMTAISRLNFSEFPVMIKMYVAEQDAGFRYRTRLEMQRPLTDEIRLRLPRRAPDETVACYISAMGAGKLVKKSRALYRPADDAVRRVWETGVTVFTVLPAPVRHGDGPSLVGPGRRTARAAVADEAAYGARHVREFNLMSGLYFPVNIARACSIFATMRTARCSR